MPKETSPWWIALLSIGALACGSDGATDVAADGDAGTQGADILADGGAGDQDTLSGDGGALDAAGLDAVAQDAGSPVPPEICLSGAGWDGKSPIFTDVTELAGIGPQGIAAKGVRLSAADLDGDLLPEIAVRRHVADKRSGLAGAERYTTVLRNLSGGAGLKFSDFTAGSGLIATRDGAQGRPTHIVVFGDVDNDGHTDVFAGMTVGPASKAEAVDASEVLINDGKGALLLLADNPFGDATHRLGLTSATFVDYDRDGNLDLWLGYGTYGDAPTADRLMKGDGKGGFVDVTTAEGLMTKPYQALADVASGAAHRNTWGTGACDLNADGHPDLYTTSYGRYFNGLWLGGQLEGASRFVDAMHSSKFGRDDNDDWTTNINAQCHCADNPTDAECDKAPKPEANCAQLKYSFGGKYRWNHQYDRSPWRLGGTTGTAICADVDRDGDLDVMQFNIVHGDVGPSSDPSHLMRNDGGAIPIFTHLGNDKTGLHHVWDSKWGWNEGDMTGAVFDFDNDGRLDILIASSDYPGTRAFLYHQQPGGSFVEVGKELSMDHRRAHGVAVADFDRDGDLDVALGHSRARCTGATDCPPDEQIHLYRNETISKAHQGGNWLQLQLVGTGGSNRSAIGARVQVQAGGVTQTAELDGGHGHYGIHNDLVLHFGLGKACKIDAVVVRWPDAKGTTETYAGVRANYLVRLTQGQSAATYPRYEPVP